MECCKHSKASGMVKSCDKEYEQVMGHTLREKHQTLYLKLSTQFVILWMHITWKITNTILCIIAKENSLVHSATPIQGRPETFIRDTLY